MLVFPREFRGDAHAGTRGRLRERANNDRGEKGGWPRKSLVILSLASCGRLLFAEGIKQLAAVDGCSALHALLVML